MTLSFYIAGSQCEQNRDSIEHPPHFMPSAEEVTTRLRSKPYHLSGLVEESGQGLSAAMKGSAGPEFTDEFRSGGPCPDSGKANG